MMKKPNEIKGLPVVDVRGTKLGRVHAVRMREQAADAGDAPEIAYLVYGYSGILELLGLRRPKLRKLEMSPFIDITPTKVVVRFPI